MEWRRKFKSARDGEGGKEKERNSRVRGVKTRTLRESVYGKEKKERGNKDRETKRNTEGIWEGNQAPVSCVKRERGRGERPRRLKKSTLELSYPPPTEKGSMSTPHSVYGISLMSTCYKAYSMAHGT